jgi:hypothetical protein
MKALYCCALVMVLAIASLVQAQSETRPEAGHDSAREKLIGAWQLVHIDAPGRMGNPLSSDSP